MPDRSIFVTGASSGIGLASTLRLSSMGFHVFAGILPGEDLSALTQGKSDRIIITPIDITQPEMIIEARQRIAKASDDNGLYGLFNNAGIAIAGPIEFMPIEALQQQLDVNLIGHVRVTQALLPMLRQAQGRIVNMASILGRVAAPFSGPYSMSKFAMEAFTDVLRMELKDFGVTVSAVEPGTIATPIWVKTLTNADAISNELPSEGQQLYAAKLQTFRDTVERQRQRGISPDEVAKAVSHAFTAPRPRTRYVVGTDAKALALLKGLLPDRLFDWTLNKLYPTG